METPHQDNNPGNNSGDDRSTQIVWVVGESAAGKETFICSQVADPDPELTDTLGWAGKTIAVAEPSLRWIGEYEGDPQLRHRDRIFDETAALAGTFDVILIKWQIDDDQNQRLETLRDHLPEARHQIIRLQADPDDLQARVQEKPWWDSGDDPAEFIEEETRHIREQLARYADGGFEILTAVASGESYQRGPDIDLSVAAELDPASL